MGSIKEYFSSVGQGVKSLLVGMGVTGNRRREIDGFFICGKKHKE